MPDANGLESCDLSAEFSWHNLMDIAEIVSDMLVATSCRTTIQISVFPNLANVFCKNKKETLQLLISSNR